jgi:hypothetical protein
VFEDDRLDPGVEGPVEPRGVERDQFDWQRSRLDPIEILLTATEAETRAGSAFSSNGRTSTSETSETGIGYGARWPSGSVIVWANVRWTGEVTVNRKVSPAFREKLFPTTSLPTRACYELHRKRGAAL